LVVGVFDSGVGGLTVAKSIIDEKLFDEVIYYGDTARVPYGTKDENTIIRYSLEAVEFFKNFNIDILVVACNTVSSYALDEMRKIAPFEVVGVIEPGVLSIINQQPRLDSNILVIGTKATVSSGIYKKMLQAKGFTNITQIETGLFVPLVEDGILDGPVMDAMLEHYFKDMPRPDYIILGCTHFPLISKAISEYFNGSTLVHSGEAIVNYLQNKFALHGLNSNTVLKLFASSSPDRLKIRAEEWLKGGESK
jgi:glutamate racemase